MILHSSNIQIPDSSDLLRQFAKLGCKSSRSGISSLDLRNDKANINTHISEKLNKLTPENGMSVFAIGVAREFHCTLAIVSKDPNFKDENGNSGTNENPIYFYTGWE